MTYRSMICGLALAMAVWSQGPPAPGELKTYLGLTDSQIQALRQIRQQEGEALRTIRDEMAQKQKGLSEQLQAGNTDAAALGRLLLDIQNLRKRIEDAQKSFRDQAANQLTVDQKTKLKALEEAAKLQPAIGQATGLNLLVPSMPVPGGVGFRPGGPGRPGGLGPIWVSDRGDNSWMSLYRMRRQPAVGHRRYPFPRGRMKSVRRAPQRPCRTR